MATTYQELLPAVEATVIANNLPVAKAREVIGRFMTISKLGRNQGRSVKWTRYNTLPKAMSPLADGIPPTSTKPTKTDITASLEQYGAIVELTDRITMTHTDPVLNIETERCMENASETIEAVRFGIAKGGTNVIYAGNVASRSLVNATISRGLIRQAVRNLSRNRARRITKMIKASALIATEPVAAAFVAVVHPDLESDVRNISGFTPVEYYSNPSAAFEDELGKAEGIRFVKSDLCEPWLSSGASNATWLIAGNIASAAASCDVYPVLIFGADSFAGVPLTGQNKGIRLHVVPPDKVDSGNRLGQVGSVGWITDQASAIINDLWMVRLEVAATASLT